MAERIEIPPSHYHQVIKPILVYPTPMLRGIRPKHREWKSAGERRKRSWESIPRQKHLMALKGNKRKPKRVTILVLEEEEFYSGKTNPEVLNPNPREELFIVLKFDQAGYTWPLNVLKAVTPFFLPTNIPLEILP